MQNFDDREMEIDERDCCYDLSHVIPFLSAT